MPRTMTGDETLTISELIPLLKSSKSSIYRNVRLGRIPAVRPTNGKLLFLRSDIDRLLTRQQHQEACTS